MESQGSQEVQVLSGPQEEKLKPTPRKRLYIVRRSECGWDNHAGVLIEANNAEEAIDYALNTKGKYGPLFDWSYEGFMTATLVGHGFLSRDEPNTHHMEDLRAG
jgi:hypothetical protein